MVGRPAKEDVVKQYIFAGLLLGACTSQASLGTDDLASTTVLQNDHSIPNYLGASATFSTSGSSDAGTGVTRSSWRHAVE